MIDQIRHLLLIVEHGTFTAAARRAHLSQPALTASIHRLEQSVGARLLRRGRRGAHLTAAGEAFLARARVALTALEEAERAAQEIVRLSRGEVRIGGGPTTCAYYLPERLAAFRARYPGIRLRVWEQTTDEALASLEEGQIDLALITSEEEGRGELWLEDPLILIASPKLELRGDLASAPFLTFRPGATSRSLLLRHFPEAQIAMELGGIEAVKRHAEHGIGVALVSRHAAREELERGSLVELTDPRTPLLRQVLIAHRGVERLPPAAAALRAHLLGEQSE